MNFTLGQIAEFLGARIIGADSEALVTAPVENDSRNIIPGGLFVALPGEHTHGEYFAHAAIDAGAVAVIATRDLGVPTLVVDKAGTFDHVFAEHNVSLAGDTDGSGAIILNALGRLARELHQYYSARGLITIAITGSVGKTTTKDFITAILRGTLDDNSDNNSIVAPADSLNNELGVPLLISRITAQTKVIVIEMGARAIGDIAYLCSLARPTIAVLLGVGSAHLGQFGSLESTAHAKSELITALESHAVAIINADDPRVRVMATDGHKITFGSSSHDDYRYEIIGVNSLAQPVVVLYHRDGVAEFTLAVPGSHLVPNAIAAIAASVSAGVDIAKAIGVIEQYKTLSPHRMHAIITDNDITIIDDAYNANPDSVKAALCTLAELGRKKPHTHTWAVLGQMLELGDNAIVLHDDIGRYAVRLNISRLLCVGISREVEAMYRGAVLEGASDNEVRLVDTIEKCSALLKDHIKPGDSVLIKASNSVKLWKIAEQLLGGAFR